jgi:hypothetical protein
MSIYGNRNTLPTQVNALVHKLEETINGSQLSTSQNAKWATSLESIDDSARQSLSMAFQDLTVSIETIARELNLEGRLTEAQRDAGAIAGILSGDYKRVIGRKPEFNAVSTESMAVVQPFGLDDAMSERSFALEAYDERENRNATIYSIAYNMQSARQDEFGETFFPTLVVTPDNVGFGVTVNLMMVYDGIERKITGSFEDFKKKNIIRAVADPTVLKKEQTRVIPVHRAQAADKFVAPAIVPAYPIMLEGESITTAPLAVGRKIDLLGISQTGTLLAAGIMDMTDALDPSVNLQNVYVKVGADVLKINTTNLPYSNFTYSTQNNYRMMTLNFSTASVLVTKSTRNADGTPLVDLVSVANNDLMVRLELKLSGSVNIETGECEVFANAVRVHSVTDSSGNLLDLAAAPAAPLVATVDAGTIEGYDVSAFRTNVNRRQRGQLIDVTKFTQLYNVPLRSPITTIHPVNTDGQTDASDVQALITATRIRTSNEAVTSLLNATSLLRDYVDARDVTGIGPDILGVGRFFVRPVFFEESIDVVDIVDSLTSTDRPGDLQQALVNKIRDYAYQMYRDSEYKAAADALSGGIAPVPVVTIGTDPVISRYLTVSGDLRTLGNDFDVRIVSTLDRRVKGKIFITFGVFDETRNTTPNPLNFGNMVWAPELVLTANISRGGTISKETVVQPRYLFVTHLPIMTELTISNIPDVIGRVAIRTHQV